MLSLSMIVRNEAKRLGRCLESVAGFADELVVVDTGSSDDTVAVAQSHGARVERIPWPGDFAPARNQALEWVRGSWVLVLDADEQLLEGAKEPLRALMADPDILLINLLREEVGALQSPYSSVSRLFRRHPQIRWSRPYHAMVDDSVVELRARESHWRVVDCRQPAIRHEGYRPELLADGRKARQLRRAMEQELRDHPGQAYASAKLGGLEISEGRVKRGISLLKAGLAGCSPEAHPERFELLLHLAMAEASRHPGRAAALYREALELPLDPRLQVAAQLNLAALQLQEGAPAEAAQLAEAVTRGAPELALGWYNLGLIRRRLGDIRGALQAYDTALELAPEHAETHQNRAVAQLLAGDISAARASFRQAIALLRDQGQTSAAQQLQRQAGSMLRLDD
ncbi:MAG: glycosyltransferase [Cyanobacteria bacterium]|nr:glycosyltransferase [Cyanobacteriota bacterium]